MGYVVNLSVGLLSWSIEQSDPEETVADGVVVLSGLYVGWAMPTNGRWPAQPGVMQATFSLNVPEFPDVDASEGDVCVIEILNAPAGDIIVRFYGDVTDYKAVPRPDRSGVNLSVIAVDYTVRTAEMEGFAGLPFGGNDAEWAAMAAYWEEFAGGPSDNSDIWTSPTTRKLWASPAGKPKVAAFVGPILDQAVDLAAMTRMVMSPCVAADGSNTPHPSGRKFTLDTINADWRNTLDPWEIPAHAVRRDKVEWSNVKGQTTGLFVATGHGGVAENRVAAAVTGATSIAISFLTVNLETQAMAQETVDFYAAANRFDPWQVASLTVEVTRAGILEDVPTGLWPNWKAAEAAASRSECYSKRIRVEGAETDLTPDGSTSIVGVLTGAACTIAGGHLTLQLALRRVQAGENFHWIFGGYGMAPYAELVPTP